MYNILHLQKINYKLIIYNIFTGTICLGIIACAVFVCANCQSFEQTQKNNRNGYAFSLLKDGTSFFDDDEKEIEIFRRPLNGKCFTIEKLYIYIFVNLY